MSDDPVKQALAELGDVVHCRCHKAYTDRGLRDPDCNCDSADALKVVSDRIEALERERDEAYAAADDAAGYAGRSEALLAKAVKGLRDIEAQPDYRLPKPQEIAAATLAEIERET